MPPTDIFPGLGSPHQSADARSPRTGARRLRASLVLATAVGVVLGGAALPQSSAAAAPSAAAAAVVRSAPQAPAADDPSRMDWRPAPRATAKPRGPRPPARPAGNRLEVGTQFHGVWSFYTDEQRAAALDKLVAMGATWVRIDMSWATIQPRNGESTDQGWGVPFYDKVIEMAHTRGLKVLGMLWLTPSWARPAAGERSAPADPEDYGRALAWAAQNWRGKVQAWEVWNEPNSKAFFASESPSQYTDMLCAAYGAMVRAGRPAKVVFGGTVHNDVDWIRRAYDAGAKGCFDVMSTHPYTGPANAGPNAGGANDPWDFNRLTAVRQLMVERGDRKPIWATEFGWSSHANTGNEQPWNMGVTEAQQARFTIEALRTLRREHPYVTKAFVYNEREKVTRDVHQNGYGIMRTDLTPKPVYSALRRYLQ